MVSSGTQRHTSHPNDNRVRQDLPRHLQSHYNKNIDRQGYSNLDGQLFHSQDNHKQLASRAMQENKNKLTLRTHIA